MSFISGVHFLDQNAPDISLLRLLSISKVGGCVLVMSVHSEANTAGVTTAYTPVLKLTLRDAYHKENSLSQRSLCSQQSLC